ncbi:MAG: sporulation protein YqfD [Bacilli bacterium]|nr:sporulation protein YqfD [Bacilli bacterium]
MKNKIVRSFQNRIVINVQGKNIRTFISRLISKKIELLNIEYVNYKEVNMEIYSDDYKKIQSIKSIYKVKIKKYHGLLRIKRMIKNNKVLLIFILFGISLVIFLSNIIFEVEVVHNNPEIQKMLLDELKEYEIKKYKRKKSYDEIKKIKIKILNEHKDKIEWLEIINIGTKYIVRVEERKIIDIDPKKDHQNIISTKDAIIKKVIAKQGQVVKNTNDYVKKGEVIISSDITLNDNIKNSTRAEGTVYGEVWYEISIEYPLQYSEKKLTNNSKKLLILKIFNYNIGFNQYKDKIIEDNIIYKNYFIPLSLSYQLQREVRIIDEVYTLDEAIDKAIILGRNKIKSKLEPDETIIMEKQLKVNAKDSKIIVDVFYSVYENITGYQEIK